MKHIDLNGTWALRWCDGQRGGMPHYIHTDREPKDADIADKPKEIADDFDAVKWIDAAVPGEVHLDLMRAGLMESPYEGVGVLHCRWVEESYWFYRTVFDAPEAVGARFSRLVFEGLDYAAVIYLNGLEIARHQNAFYPCAVDVAGRLKPTGNVLLVRLESGLFSVSDKPIRPYYTATMTMDVLLHKRNWLRKTQSQMAWDWSPRLMNVGIYKPVSLQYSDELLVDSCAVTCTLDDALEAGTVEVRVFVADRIPELAGCRLSVTVDGHTEEVDFADVPANGVLSATLTVENPRLWWPAGYGEPALYDVDITLFAGGIAYIDRKTVGFRHVRVNRDPHPVEGHYFVFEINKKPVFMRGSNLVPNDLITAAATPARYERLVELAREANFNFLRVWGGGLYESGAFYVACDRAGIMVWQEFIAACAVIPADEALTAEIEREAVYNVRRLSCHPSLVAWCGNNEIDWGADDPVNDGYRLGEDNPLYRELFPAVLRREDPTKYYQPTSPYSADGTPMNNEVTGDQHPWAVGFVNKDSRDYERMVCRFANEGGVLGPNSLKTVKACLTPGEGMHSFSWQTHDNMLENWMPGSSADDDVRFWLDRSPRDMTLEEYVYAGGMVHADGLKRYIDNFRRRKYDSSGAVFWMYNDCWPTTRSWTVVDYYLRRTPAYHPVRRAMEPVAPVIAMEEDFIVYGVNDTLTAVVGLLHVGAFTTDGRTVYEEKQPVMLAANRSVELARIPRRWVEDAGMARTLTFACLYAQDGALIARTRYTPLRHAELELPAAAIRTRRTDEGYVFESDRFVMGVCLGLDGDEPVGDNLFDLFPGQPYAVKSGLTADNPVIFTMNDLLAGTGEAARSADSRKPRAI